MPQQTFTPNRGRPRLALRPPLSLALTLALTPLPALAEADIDQAAQLSEQQRLAITRQYLMERSYLHADQRQQEQHRYQSGVGQQGSNQGHALGHQLDQRQGGVSVGSLVSETGPSGYPHATGSNGGWQYAPQSNSLLVGGDSYAPISLSNINAQNGSVHIGDTYKGNMYGSQIGNNQYGGQSGATVNDQQNQQGQEAGSTAGSADEADNQGGNPS